MDSRKMYNTRLKAWGLTKNFKASEVHAILHVKKARDAAGKASYMAIRNETVDPERLATYLRRNGTVLAQLEAGEAESEPPGLASTIVCRTPSPAPAPRGPDHVLEEALYRMRDYVDGNFSE